jgi:hypothetical protein
MSGVQSVARVWAIISLYLGELSDEVERVAGIAGMA